MADTLISSKIENFISTHVDLDSLQVKKGRKSRDWLIDQLEVMAVKTTNFPPRYTQKHKGFGSFHRSTKKRPLDDIDQLFCLSASGEMHYSEEGDTICINIDPENTVYKHFASTTDKTKLSSIRIVNLIVNSLKSIEQYKNSPARDGEAATLQATSYDWNFDIVPCFFTAKDAYENDFYLIPDGTGNWKKTDPRKDKERSASVNQKRNGKVLKLIRVMKYWNKRPTMPTMGSYLLENMVLDYCDKNELSNYIEHDIKYLLQHISKNIFCAVNDPKGMQGNLNRLDDVTCEAICSRALSDIEKLEAADTYEVSDPRKAIEQLRIVFGNDFPKYEG